MLDELALLASAVGDDGAHAIHRHFEAVSLAAGERILTDGQPSSWLFVVVEGELEVFVDGPEGRVDVGVRGPGSWLGEVGVIDGGPASATVEARGAAKVLRIGRERLVKLADERPQVATVLL